MNDWPTGIVLSLHVALICESVVCLAFLFALHSNRWTQVCPAWSSSHTGGTCAVVAFNQVVKNQLFSGYRAVPDSICDYDRAQSRS